MTENTISEEKTTLSTSRVARLAAELFGSFFLFLSIYGICSYGTVFTFSVIGSNILTVGLAVGLVYGVLTYLFGKVSGAHLNPAVSFAELLLGRIDFFDFLAYVILQSAGAIGAAEIITHILPVTSSSDSSASSKMDMFTWIHYAINGYGNASPSNALMSQMKIEFGMKFAVLLEIAMSIIVIAVVLKSQNSNGAPKKFAPLTIGAAYAVGTAVAFPVSGAALNPARATGMAVAAQSVVSQYNTTQQASAATNGTTFVAIALPVSQLWVFWVAPVLAAALVALINLVIKLRNDDTTDVEPVAAKPKKNRKSSAAAKESTAAEPKGSAAKNSDGAHDGDADDAAEDADGMASSGIDYAEDDVTDEQDL